ncbi:MAG: hypothetical protein IR164_03085 [Devosia sp.]|jgi:hypothetical protein|uniref:hypothetical protein n=1 Tax=unclassified Devosia TaxID=196773 RepID=UPI0019F70E07|nr:MULTISPECIES: hypothetical protein [unclassified Devosia]MBF0677910.1 hypothetical protein [Devosia sp.]WEJ33525.1 hypothetical protein NYQ88_01500 [Devosia sp. SD17-2]
MKTQIFALVTGFSLLATAAYAAPTSAQKQEFFEVCMGISQNQELCACKADAAMTLIDERFMGVVISSMKGGAPAAADFNAYNTYVAKSNQVCKPNY